MAAMDVEIKTEPMDMDYPSIKQEELIIKSELDDESLHEQTQMLENELQNSFDWLIPKDEPVDEADSTQNNTFCLNEEAEKNLLPSEPTSQLLLQCGDCKGYFAGERGLSAHRRVRCRSTNHICSVCGQVFRTSVILKAHMQRHKQKNSPSKETKTPPPTRRVISRVAKASPTELERVLYACNTCEMAFTKAQSLMNHNRIHGGPKHICSQCGKCFKNTADLRNHRKKGICAKEALAEVFRDRECDINIKEEEDSDDSEDDSDDESLTEQMLLGSAIISKVECSKNLDVVDAHHCNNIEIKTEKDEAMATTVIKEETVSSYDDSNDTQGFNDLLLQELLDRKAKSIEKERKAISDTRTSQEKNLFNQIKQEPIEILDSPSLEHTDFEDVITSNTLTLQATTQNITHNSNKIESPQGQTTCLDELPRQGDSTQTVDFDEVITSSTLPNFQAKSEVIQSLKEEYQKAKKKKIDERASTDKSNQHSLAVPPKKQVAPSSMFFTLSGDPEPYNEVVRKLDKNYRYTWICPSCPRRYVQRYAFVKHLTSTHFTDPNDLNDVLFELKPEPYHPSAPVDSYCHLCRVTLVDVATLRKHKSEFHKEDTSTKSQFKCEKCGKICSTRSTLADHVQANCGTEPQYGCAVCGKKFYTKSTLNLHRTMHTGELPHQCRYCEKRFRTRGQLTVHTRTHTGERPFPCKVCDKRFTHRETLIAHLSRHIDMKRYKCYGCQQFFSCISGLKTHRLTRMETCGKVKLNARPVGPRVRVIKGNVIFEPQPKINPYYRNDVNASVENTKKNGNFQENVQNQENLNDLVNNETIPMVRES